MSEITNWPTVDDLPRDACGLRIIPQGYPLWHEALEANREDMNVLLASKADISGDNFTGLVTINNIPVATTKEPDHHTLEGGDYIGGFYWKTQDNMVLIWLNYSAPTGTAVTGKIAGYLPVGFRPTFTNIKRFPVILTGSTNVVIGECYLTPSNGELQINALNPAMSASAVLNHVNGFYCFFIVE